MRELGDLRVVGHTLTNLGLVKVAQLDFNSAAALFEESITLMRQVGDTRSAAITLAHQAGLERRLGNHDASLAMAGESLRALDEVGDPIGVRMALEVVAAALVARGRNDDVEAAARLLGAASLLPSGRAELGSVETGSVDTTEQTARRLLGDATFDAAFARGVEGGQATAVALAAEIAR